MSHEAADLETTDQDEWDMQRLGKAQQLKVCALTTVGGCVRSVRLTGAHRETSASTRFWASLPR